MSNIENLSVLLLLSGATLTVALGVLIIMQARPLNALRGWFSGVCASAALWMLTNALFKTADNQQQYVLALVSYVSAAMLAMSIAVFCMYVVGRPAARTVRLLVIWGVALIAIGGLPGVLASSIHDDTIVTNRIVALIYGAGIAGLIIIGVFALTVSIRKSSKKLARPAVHLLSGLMSAAVVGLTANLILPIGFNNYHYVAVGPLGVIFFIIASAYAIVRHGLFDVRIAAVRTLAYVLSLMSMAGVYFGLAYVISATIFQGASTDGVSMSPVNIFLASVLAFAFQPIKHFFDHVTDKIFFRNRYDRGIFISELGDILTSTTDLRTMLNQTAKHIQNNLKATHATFVVFHEKDSADIISGSIDKPMLKTDELEEVSRCVRKQTKLLVIDDTHEGDSTKEERHIRKLLRRYHIAAIMPLSDQIGYLLLGDHKSSGYSSRDIGVLETISDELVIAIQNARSVQEVQDLNASLQQRIDRATNDLRRSNSKLRKLDETKDEFISMASHQLRTPLTSIKGYLSMVLEGDAGDISPQQKKLLEEAFTSSERMVRLIGDFLNVSRLQTGKFVIDQSRVDIASLVAEEVDSIQSLVSSHGQSVNYRKPAQPLMVMLDENKTRQVVMNFIDNAIYYSPENTTITIRVYKSQGHAVFEVHDRGIGVPKEEQAKLFTKFYRAENARRKRPDGTGVGIFLAKRVIEAQGGEVIFHSQEGLGSVFGFKLPLKK